MIFSNFSKQLKEIQENLIMMSLFIGLPNSFCFKKVPICQIRNVDAHKLLLISLSIMKPLLPSNFQSTTMNIECMKVGIFCLREPILILFKRSVKD